jgi:hypothetical protein
MKSKTKKHGVICLVLAFLVPVAGILMQGTAIVIHGVYTEWLGTVLLEQILPLLNPDAPHRVFIWIDECFLFFTGVTFCAFPVLLYSAIIRFVTPKAEEVYLIPKLSLWTNVISATCGVGIVTAIELFGAILATGGNFTYPNRLSALSIFLPIVIVAFLVLAFVYIFTWHKAKDGEGNPLPLKVIYLDILRGILAFPGYALLAAIGYNVLLILFSDAF